MTYLEDVSDDELRAALDDVESAKAALRLVIALSYGDGVAVDEMSERYGIPRSTIYYWLGRFEDRSIVAAVEDERRPGRPPRLGDDDRERLRADLADSPAEHGHDDDAWSPELVQRHLRETYDVDYSLGHVRRLLREIDG